MKRKEAWGMMRIYLILWPSEDHQILNDSCPFCWFIAFSLSIFSLLMFLNQYPLTLAISKLDLPTFLLPFIILSNTFLINATSIHSYQMFNSFYM